MNYWDVPIIIGKKERFWETVGALVFHLLSQYSSWIGDWETIRDALTTLAYFVALPAAPGRLAGCWQW